MIVVETSGGARGMQLRGLTLLASLAALVALMMSGLSGVAV